MTATSEATTVWRGDLLSGSGTTTLDSSGSGVFAVDWRTRTHGSTGATTPEELLGAAHASCFSMAFAHALAQFGTPPESLQTTAAVTFDPAVGITGSHLLVSAVVPGIDEADFERLADEAKTGCPVSRALTGIPITLEASLA
ncbi:OsmC family peroxiredoxin [Herbiconiux moechotypicola]|uniref:OsmC family peroxiredoxin n=1 Tax=Herbiconiux moechotypicola TaxID=637393 RepID=A0ABN3D7I8_9MICO|nr:OsmC family peroxiredoxin [Herbiconiux moechotypicola]MCS5728494.1 OsmC family peroxiredoxin [Herbiconiux moechotypicola]